jgi:hypothetical protein
MTFRRAVIIGLSGLGIIVLGIVALFIWRELELVRLQRERQEELAQRWAYRQQISHPVEWNSFVAGGGSFRGDLTSRCRFSDPIGPGRFEFNLRVEVPARVAEIWRATQPVGSRIGSAAFDSAYRAHLAQMPFRLGTQPAVIMYFHDEHGFSRQEIPVLLSQLSYGGQSNGRHVFSAQHQATVYCNEEVANLRSWTFRTSPE